MAHAVFSGHEGFELCNVGRRDKGIRADMENLRRRVAFAGPRCKDILRCGAAAATLYDIADEECADLLLVGAYGNGSRGRKTLGSTAELLLRSIPCPVLTYGPKINKSLLRENAPISILVPIELPCDPLCLTFAVSVAKLFKAKLEVLHVVDMSRAASLPHAFQDIQYTCEEITSYLRTDGVEVAGSLLFGKPDTAIVSRSQELQKLFHSDATGNTRAPFFSQVRQCRYECHQERRGSRLDLPNQLRREQSYQTLKTCTPLELKRNATR